MVKPFITGDCPALHELLIDKKSGLFCKMTDAGDLAKKIIELKRDRSLRKKISREARKIFAEKVSFLVLGKQLKNIIYSLLENE